jgi:PTH1 family peptidyl-tRNA hydrolase
MARRVFAGLGNPGKAFTGTRHNVGYEAVECLAERLGLNFSRHRQALVAQGQIDAPQALEPPLNSKGQAQGSQTRSGMKQRGGVEGSETELSSSSSSSSLSPLPLALLLPREQMNVNGAGLASALSEVLKLQGASLTKAVVSQGLLLAVADDATADFGTIRLAQKRSIQAHGGLRSLAAVLRTQEFLQLRLGVGRPPQGQAMADHVLGHFASGEMSRLPAFYEAAGEAMRWLLAAELDSRTALEHARRFVNKEGRFDI